MSFKYISPSGQKQGGKKKKITLPEDLVACSKEEQKRREEVADPSQEGWAKYGPLTGTRGLTSGLTD